MKYIVPVTLNKLKSSFIKPALLIARKMKKNVSNPIRPDVTGTAAKKQRPYWTIRRLAARLGRSPAHVFYVLRGQRPSALLVEQCVAEAGFDRFAEMADPDVVRRYIASKS